MAEVKRPGPKTRGQLVVDKFSNECKCYYHDAFKELVLKNCTGWKMLHISLKLAMFALVVLHMKKITHNGGISSDSSNGVAKVTISEPNKN